MGAIQCCHLVCSQISHFPLITVLEGGYIMKWINYPSELLDMLGVGDMRSMKLMITVSL